MQISARFIFDLFYTDENLIAVTTLQQSCP